MQNITPQINYSHMAYKEIKEKAIVPDDFPHSMWATVKSYKGLELEDRKAPNKYLLYTREMYCVKLVDSRKAYDQYI